MRSIRTIAPLALALSFLPSAAAAPRETPPPPPAAADPLPAGASARLGTALFRAGDNVYGSALLPDGKSLLVAGAGRDPVRVLDLTTGLITRRYNLPESGWQQVAFAGGPDKLIVSNYNGVCLWDLTTSQMVRDLTPAARRGNDGPIDVSADGKRVVVCGPRYRQPAVPAVVYDAAKGEQLASVTPLQNADVKAALSPDGSLVATYGTHNAQNEDERKKNIGQFVLVSNVADGKEKYQLATEGFQVARVAFSPDGKLIATSSGAGTIRLWDAKDGKSLTHLAGRRGQGQFLVFSPDGSELAAASAEGLVQRWETATGKRLGICDPPGGRFVGLQYTANDRLLAWSLDGSAVNMVEAISGKRLTPDGGHRYPVMALCFLPDGKSLLSASNEGRVVRWEMPAGKQAAEYRVKSDDDRNYAPGYTRLRNYLAFTADGRYLTYAGDANAIHLCEADTGREVCVFENQNSFDTRLSLSPDGSALAAGGQNTGGVITVWGVESGQPLHKVKLPPVQQVTGMACSANGARLAMGSYHNTPQGQTVNEFRIIDTATGRELRKDTLPYYGGSAMAFSRDGRRLAVHQPQQGSLQLWDARTGQSLHAFEGRVQAVVAPMAFSPDGRSLAVAAFRQDGQQAVQIFEVASGTLRYEFAGLPSNVSSLAFAPDGLTLATGHADTTVLLWDVSGGVGPGKVVTLKPSPVEELWPRLAETNAKDIEGVRVQMLVQPESTVGLIRKEVRPVPKSEATAERIAALIADIDGRTFRDRERATRELTALGRLTVPAIDAALAKEPTPEARTRLRAIRERVDQAEPVSAYLRPLRAIELLERLATPAAREALKELADGSPDALVTEEAAAALGRLK